MTTLYSALIVAQAGAFVVLAEIQPAEILGPFTAAGGGLTNTYTAPFATLVSTPDASLYRRPDFVRQDGTTLTSRASAALVNSNLGSYWFDTANSLVYISTTTGTSPNLFAMIGAWFTVFFCSTSVSFSDQPLYRPILAGNMPAVESEMPDLLFGATIAPAGQLELQNALGMFDKISRKWVWRNKKVTFKLGGVGLAYSDFATIETLQVNGAQVTDESFVLTLEGTGSVLNQSIPSRTWGETGLSVTVEAGASGQSAPWLFGTVADCPLTRSNRFAADAVTYTIDTALSGAGVSIANVYAIAKSDGTRTTLTYLAQWGLSGSSGILLLDLATYPDADYTFRADLTDANDTGTIGKLMVRLLGLLGVAAADIDTAAFTAADSAVPYHLGAFLNSPMQAAEFVRSLEQSTCTQTYRNSDGKWTIRPIDPSVADYTLTDADFSVWEPEEDLNAVLSNVRVKCALNPATGDSIEVAGTFSGVQYASETSDSHSFTSYLTNAADASVICQRHLFFKSAAPMLIHFEQRGLSMMDASVGDYVAVTRARGPVARTGKFDGQLLRVVKLTKTLGPVPTVSGVLNDLNGRCDQIFRLAPAASTLTWATATDAERALYGFLSDANQYIDPADALTRGGYQGNYGKVLY